MGMRMSNKKFEQIYARYFKGLEETLTDAALKEFHDEGLMDVRIKLSSAKHHLRNAYILAGICLIIGLISGFGAVTYHKVDDVLFISCSIIGVLSYVGGIYFICGPKTRKYRKDCFEADPHYFIDVHERIQQERENNKKRRAAE